MLRAWQKAKGARLLRRGDFAGALQAWDTAEYKAGLLQLVDDAVHRGDLLDAEEAMAKAGSAISLEQYREIGDRAFQRGAMDTAQTAYERAEYPKGLAGIAEAFLEAGKFQRAEAALGQALDRQRLISFGHRCLAEEKPRTALAVQAFDYANSPEDLLAVSDHYENTGDSKRALEIVERAVRLGAPDSLTKPRVARLGSVDGVSSGTAAPALAPDERTCPACAQVIKQAALKCRFCGAVLDAQLASQDVPAYIANDIDTNAGQALTYSIISIFICAPILGPTAISRGNAALRLLRQHPAYEGRSSARGKATAGVIIGWIALALFVLVLIGRFSNL